jgi:hypothetical protein
LIISGCSLIPQRTVKIDRVQTEIKTTQPPLPRSIELADVEWFVVTEDNMDEILKDIEKQSGYVVFVAMTIADYELMSSNMQELKRYINELGAVIVYYKQVTQ